MKMVLFMPERGGAPVPLVEHFSRVGAHVALVTRGVDREDARGDPARALVEQLLLRLRGREVRSTTTMTTMTTMTTIRREQDALNDNN